MELCNIFALELKTDFARIRIVTKVYLIYNYCCTSWILNSLWNS